MQVKPPFSKNILKLIDAEQTASSIADKLKYDVRKTLKRNGAIVGISGGIDSSVTLALAVKAFGASHVLGIMLPEHDSSSDSKLLAQELADTFGVRTIEENISGALEGFKCYERRDEAVISVFPEFDPAKDKFKIEIKQSVDNMKLPPMFYVTVHFAHGKTESKMLTTKAFLQIVAASNFKQRSRMTMLYYHAEVNHFAVIGTPNKHEVKQGFFVKYGDGGADVMPIAHLYKTQVYQLAKHLGVPEQIISRTPTTDTYPAEQTQEDFFFQFPYETLDLLWYAWENDYPKSEIGEVMGYSEEEVASIFTNFERKAKTTEYLRMPPIQ